MMRTLSVCAVFLCCFSLFGKVVFEPLFGDNAVLAKKSSVPIWGKAEPGEKIVVSINGISAGTTADAKGKWMVKLDLSECGEGPFELKANDTVSRNVIVGQVFFASGQSNMEWPLRATTNLAPVLAKSNDRKLRIFTVPSTFGVKPLETVNGRWMISCPELAGECSAIGYLFGQNMREALGQPVGMICAGYGGAHIDSLMHPDAAVPASSRSKTRHHAATVNLRSYEKRAASYIADLAVWAKKNSRFIARPETIPADLKWQTVPAVSRKFANGGVVWIRYSVNVTEQDIADGVSLKMGRPKCIADIFVNGKLAASRDHYWALRGDTLICNFPAGIKAGKNEIVLRLYDPLKIEVPFWHWANKTCINTSRKWDIAVEKEFPPLSEAEKSTLPQFKNNRRDYRMFTSMIHNEMIAPLYPLAINGIVWYQGESESGNIAFHRLMLPILIKDYRKRFEDNDLPFVYCQIANYGDKTSDPAAAGWAQLREVQYSGLALPKTAMAILTDCGESADIHPRDKQTPAKRLAAAMLAIGYGRDVPYRGPKAISASASGKEVTVTFEMFGRKLAAKAVPAKYAVQLGAGRRAELVRNSPAAQLENFALRGRDGKWYWADKAEITGDSTVKISAAAVPDPVMVSYNWNSNPSGNLYNDADLPAEQFRLQVK